MNRNLTHADEPDDANDLAPMDEIEFEEWDDIDTAVEVELLLGRMQATACCGG